MRTGCLPLILLMVLALAAGLMTACSKEPALPRGVFAEDLVFKGEKADPPQPVVQREESDLPPVEIEEVTDDWLLLVNKTHPLSKSYEPVDMVRIQHTMGSHAESMRYMRQEAAGHFYDMMEAAKEAGYTLGIRTAYRSYEQQYNIFWNYVAQDGEEAANKYSARPGQSEHQTGLCADVTSPAVDGRLTTDFGQVAEGIWLAENAHRFGFIIRYPLGKEAITGYQYEPWHVRYVGAEAAAQIYAAEQTLEEYLNVLH